MSDHRSSTEGSAPAWDIAIDRGGTFTDLVAQSRDGRIIHRKVLSGEGQEALAIARLLKDEGGALAELRIGTTVATNALLTGEGAEVGLLITEGMQDSLLIGDQRRPDLFSLDIPAAGPLAAHVLPVGGRLLADGTERHPLDEAQVLHHLRQLQADGVAVVVIAFVHSHLHPKHELRAAELAAPLGFDSVILSHKSSPGIGFGDRCATAVAEGFVSGPLARYRKSLTASLGTQTDLHFMKSSGGLSPAPTFRGIDAVLSGPAGGAVACGRLATRLGLGATIGFDMGGTSTDVCRWEGGIPLRSSVQIAGRHLRVPCIDIVTVAAGGGSLLRLQDGRVQVGPSSAGADPGPAAYGAGGPATVTDANVVLGRLRPEYLPRVFGRGGDSSLDSAAGLAAISALGDRAPHTQAAGFLAVANATMAAASSALCLARGQDPASHSLIAFGGAAGQHACGVANRLRITHVVLPPNASVLSASGIAEAQSVALRSMAVLEEWDDELRKRWAERVSSLVAAAKEELGQGDLRVTVSWWLRYSGSKDAIAAQGREDFEQIHEARLGFRRPGRAIEATKVEVRLSTVPEVQEETLDRPSGGAPGAGSKARSQTACQVGYPGAEGQLVWLETPVYDRSTLSPGEFGVGPAMIVDALTTALVDPGWSFEVGSETEIHLRRTDSGAPEETNPAEEQLGGTEATVLLGLYFARFSAIATRMGEALRRVAWSVNIKERLDFSCALFDLEGNLVTNAPHIPVHLGAMGATVRALSARLGGALQDGRSWATNDPYAGGSHLPDITVVTPMFHEGELFAWVANRGHHCDVGGVAPGSMPSHSTRLAEEGVVLRDLLLVEQGEIQEAEILGALNSPPWPCRDPKTVLGDLEAQIAANTVGLRELKSLIAEVGPGSVAHWMARIQDNGAEVTRAWIGERAGKVLRSTDQLDDGCVIAVALHFGTDEDGRPHLIVDFSGTGPASESNLNAPPPVTRAAFLYVLRAVLGRNIPLNEGCLRAVELRIPKGSILDPPAGSAVVGGNVETSQRVVDVLLAALGAAAASQGTMNNLSFGNSGFGYYETIGGGAGATPTAPGRSGVHTHMTNTRITDVEVLERRHPVLLRRFELREGSGGKGRHRGGDGLVREIEFLDDFSVSLLAQRRETSPPGLAGGCSGAPGGAEIGRRGADPLPIAQGSFSLRVEPGDVLRVLTPGGGGWGPPAGS